ncbi:MAG: hypothetical protein IKK91_07800 [Ruminococcus sp.]|nr:hypothetical protein [Ruminococcus sp.]
MAKIGLRNFMFGQLVETESQGTVTYSYGKGYKPAKAINCSVSITSNNAVLRADDGVAESDTSFQSGTVSIGLDDDNLEMQARMLGHTISSGVITRKVDDMAPYLGLARIVTKVVGGVYKYKVEFLSKVQFSEPAQEDNTRAESIEFGTITMEGQVMTRGDGEWSKAEEFTSMSDAQTYMESLFGSTPTL